MEAKFHLPGLRRNYPLNITFLRLFQEHPEYLQMTPTRQDDLERYNVLALLKGGKENESDPEGKTEDRRPAL